MDWYKFLVVIMFSLFFKYFYNDSQYKLKKTLNEADNAVKFAHSIILKSYTSLNANSLDENRRKHLYKGIAGSDMKELEGIGLKDIIAEKFRSIQINPLFDKKYYTLKMFNIINETTSKYSLGNCEEFAYQALDYLLRNCPDINAEIYKIENGDHAFLVLNRNWRGEAHLPKTWGEEAIICDPWAGKSYPAKEVDKYLKNYLRDEENYTNHVEDYDPNIHFLMPFTFMSTYTLR